jgi:hypothetical protein
VDLIECLQQDAAVSYKEFRDANELRELVQNDLALLLTERFASSAGAPTTASHSARPADVDGLVGREQELTRLHKLLASGARAHGDRPRRRGQGATRDRGWRGDYAGAVPALAEALAVFTSVGDRHRATLARLPLCVAQAGRGDRAAIDSLPESRAVLAEIGDEWGLIAALNGLCWSLNALQVDAPLDVFEQARRQAETVGTTAELATDVGNLSRRKALRGEPSDAKLLVAEALEMVLLCGRRPVSRTTSS